MKGIIDSIKGIGEFIVKLTKFELLRFIIFCILVTVIWRMLLVEAENKDLRLENRNFNTECNIIIANLKDSLNRRRDSLVAIIVQKNIEVQMKENKLLQDKLDEIRKIQQNVNKVTKSNDKIIKQNN